MLTSYLLTHLDQGVLGLGTLTLMVWSGNSDKLQNKFLIAFLALAAFFSAARSCEIYAQTYTLFLLLHLFLMSVLLPLASQAKELRFYALLWAMAGHLMIEAPDWITLFIGGELLSLPLYAWFSCRKVVNSLKESASYFIQNALLSSLFLISLSILYGHKQSLHFASWEDGLWADLFWVLALSWLFFKLGVAPFSYWVPKIYDLLSPVEILWLTLVPKIALIASISQISTQVWGEKSLVLPQKILLAATILTAIWGHSATWQSRKWADFFAYSAIAQNSFLLAPLILGSNSMILSLLIQITYTVSLSIFFYQKKENSAVYRFGLLNLTGLPPTPLFFCKLLIILKLMSSGYIALASFLLLISVVALSYYLRIYSHPLEGNKSLLLNLEK